MGKETRNRNFQQRSRPYQKQGWKGHQRNNPRNEDGEQRQREPFVAKVNLREDQVGITEYVSSAPGFTGVVKSRFSDFHVNEIALSGAVTQLNDMKIPQPIDDALSAEEVEAARAELKDVLTETLWTQIEALAAAKPKDSVAAAPIEIEVSLLDKEQRTTIHKVLKKLYTDKLVSTTIGLAAATTVDKVQVATGAGGPDADALERKFIKVMKPKGRDRNRWGYPGDFVHFLLHKENMDTTEVAAAIADRMGMGRSSVNYCGTKDKRAKTTQTFCVKRREPRQIVGAVKMLRNVYVGNFTFSNDVLKLGDLKGNRFRIALRHVSGNQAEIERALTDMREHGFINYFGLQRFGNCASVPTYEVGLALLKSDYKLACELILKPRDNDLPFMRSIRETWWRERNSSAAAAMFRGRDKFIEKRLLDGLAQYGEKDYAAALRKIPRNMLLLYPHAFQSYVFNCIASRRLKEFGMQLIPGDLVYRNKDELDALELTAEIEEDDEATAETEEADTAEAVASDDAATEKKEESFTAGGDSIYKRKVKALTSEEIASGAYTLFDVVLPMPGYDITYPENAVATWYKDLLQVNDLSSEKLRHKVKTLAMAGAYRKLLLQPTQMSWKFRGYDSAESTLIASDWELMKPGMHKNIADEEQSEGKFKALLLDFCLPPSAYATMMLRELLKCDTSAASQTQLEQDERQKAADKSAAKEDGEKVVVVKEEIKKEFNSDEANNKSNVECAVALEKRKTSDAAEATYTDLAPKKPKQSSDKED